MCMGCPFAYPVDDFSYVCVASEDEDGGCKVISDNSYDKKVEDWCPLMDLPEKMMDIIQSILPMLDSWRDGISALMRLQEECR